MVLALIRSSLACLASRFSHCTQQGCWFGGFCHQKNSNSAPDLGTENHIPSSPFVVSAISVRAVSGSSLCRFRADRDGPSVGRQLRRGPQQAVRRNHEFHPAGLRALQRWSSRSSGGTPGAGHADPGDEPHGGSGSLAADRAFVEVLMRKSHFPGPPCDSLVMFGPLNCPFGF